MKVAREIRPGAGSSVEPTLVPVVETVAVQPVFVDGLHTADVDRHGIARLSLFHEQRDAYGGGLDRVLAVRLVMPAAILAEVTARMLAASRVAEAAASEIPDRPLN